MPMGESYTHLLISVSKTYRPPAQAICHFLERMIQTGSAGQDHKISFGKVVKSEPRSWEGLNPFTREMHKHTMPSRRRQRAEHLSAASQIAALAEQEPEYDVSIVSTVPPTHPPLEIGGIEKDGTWQAWTAHYHLGIHCRVRNSLVRLCYLKSGEDPNGPLPEIWIPMFDEDCSEDELDGFFEHPLSPSPIRVPKAGCGRFWIEFEYGKWLYPKLKNDSVVLLDLDVTRLATETFGTAFVEACSWG
jgi:hypothetical protein